MYFIRNDWREEQIYCEPHRQLCQGKLPKKWTYAEQSKINSVRAF